jgi:pimeloyl-ACP methyl ester carboxylesterase
LQRSSNFRQAPGAWGISPCRGSEVRRRQVRVDPARLEGAVDALAIPTLLVRGRSSDLLSEEGAQDFLACAPHAQFADVAGAGHMVAGDRNEVFDRAILDFLDHHPA